MSNKIYHIDHDIKDALIQTFSFDHNLSDDELIDLEENSVIYKNVNHIYFKDGIDLVNITKVKSLLETSNLIDDEKIEKYILIDFNDSELEEVLDINYLNPDTWKISYIRYDKKVDIYSITECRKLINYFENFFKKQDLSNLSILEKICLIYDRVKLVNYKDVKNNLLSIIENNYTNSYGYTILFQEFLKRLNIDSYVEEVTSSDGNRFVIFINVNDVKYKIQGIYVFDPLMDSLDGEYDDKLKDINYNYFCVGIKKYQNNNYDDSISGILRLFLFPNEMIFNDHIDEINLFERERIEKFVNYFGNSYIDIYNMINNTDLIDEDVLFKVIENIYKTGNDKLNIIKKNYFLREKEIFVTEELDKDLMDIYE